MTMFTLIFLAVSYFILFINPGIVNSEQVTIRTRLGDVIGIKQLAPYNTTVYEFLNIPFARPPVGKLRFAKPEPYGGWNNTLNATALGPACIQPVDPFNVFKYHGFSEDCLQLNIYVPYNITSGAKRSVMVWIHGGAYIGGSGSIYNGSTLATKGDVVVVTINYRLSLFGFLSYNNSVAKGNYGIWDQILALKWVHDNIADYSGDPSSVTIFGESAGGFSVSLLSLIPSNKGLFNRVIAESGVADSFFAIAKDRKTVSVGFGDTLGCVYDPITKDYNKILECLRSKTADEILKVIFNVVAVMGSSVRVQLPVGPNIDGELFNDEPSLLLADKKSAEYAFYRSLDMIIGNCNTEGSLYLSMSPKEEEKYGFNLTVGIPNEFFCNELTPSISDLYFNRNHKVTEAICNEYGITNNIAEQSRQVLDMYTDLFFIAPSILSLDAHSNGNTATSTYQYIFSNKTPLPYGAPRPPWFQGAGHGAEIVFVFGIESLSYLHLNATQEEYNLASNMMDYWTSFAKTGNPNGGNSPKWPQYDTADKHYMQLNTTHFIYNTSYDADRVKFWLVTVPNLLA